MSTPEQLELRLKEIAPAPRVTLEQVEDFIKSEHYFTAREGVEGTYRGGTDEGTVIPDEDTLKCMTFCVLVLQNGFSVTGESACASPENYNRELGNELAKKNAVNKIWAFLGFELRTRLTQEKETTFYQRLTKEYKELHDKTEKLGAYLKRKLPEEERRVKQYQFNAMIQYREALLERLSNEKPE